MTVNQRIIEAVKEIAPCYPWEAYEGSQDETLKEYFVFNYTINPITFGNDIPIMDRYDIQLHYFCPLGQNSLKVRRDIRKRIFDTGVFTIPEETNATDSEGQHFVFEFQTMDTVFDEEETTADPDDTEDGDNGG